MLGAALARSMARPVWCSLHPGKATYCRVKASPSFANVSSQMDCCSPKLRQPDTGTMVPRPPAAWMQADNSFPARRSMRMSG